MDIFSLAVLAKISGGQGRKSKLFLYSVGIAIEGGIQDTLEGLCREYPDLTREAALAQLREMAGSVPADELLASESIATSLAISFFHHGKGRETSEKTAWLVGDLSIIFSKEIVNELSEAAWRRIRKLLGSTPAELNASLLAHHEERRRFFLTLRDESVSLSRSSAQFPSRARQWFPEGTRTKMVPCPKCGHEKRVADGQTKRFRCKNPQGCDFDSPYPFPKS